MRTYNFNEVKQQLEIYRDNMLDAVISEVYSEEEAIRLFKEYDEV